MERERGGERAQCAVRFHDAHLSIRGRGAAAYFEKLVHDITLLHVDKDVPLNGRLEVGICSEEKADKCDVV